MTWTPLLLADPSPCLRLMVLRDLFNRDDSDPEVAELAGMRAHDPLVEEVLRYQQKDGSWGLGTVAAGRIGGSQVLVTGFALARLGHLGFDRSHPAVRRGAEFLFSSQLPDGSWALEEEAALTDGSSDLPQNERYTMIPLQTALPLRGLAACGFAGDPRAERAYEWLLAQRLEDGAWPTGIAAGVYGGVGGYRRLAHSRWGCRSNTTGALICLALHPERRRSPEARKALDLLLGRETRDASALGVETARLLGAAPARGFLTYFARFDLALLLDLCARVGVSTEDERVKGTIEFVRGLQGEFGLWEHPQDPRLSRWLTFDLLRSLSQIDLNEDWISMEPRTPFQAYSQRKKRF